MSKLGNAAKKTMLDDLMVTEEEKVAPVTEPKRKDTKQYGLDYNVHNPKDPDLLDIPPFLKRSTQATKAEAAKASAKEWELGVTKKACVEVPEARLYKIADELNKYVGDVLEEGEIILSREVAMEMREHFNALLARCYVPHGNAKASFLPIKVIKKNGEA